MDRIAQYRKSVDHYREQIAHIRQNLEWHEAGIMQLREIDDQGRITDLTQDLIEHDKRTITKLEEVIKAYEARIQDAPRP